MSYRLATPQSWLQARFSLRTEIADGRLAKQAAVFTSELTCALSYPTATATVATLITARKAALIVSGCALS